MYVLNNNAKNEPDTARAAKGPCVKMNNVKYKLITNLIVSIETRIVPLREGNATDV